MELAGEAGEAANAGKKLARHELGMVGGSDDLTNLKEELGDVIICCELIAGHYGIDLWQAVVDKFNKTSEKHGMPVKITDKLQSRPKEPDIVSGSRPSAVPGCKCEDCKIARARKTRTG
jgi:NTP pyrophosphatase (non-canonical NTP hydrolase)